MVRCSFCGYTLEPATGKMFVKNDGRIFNFCSNRCEKNLFKLGRAPKKSKWTKIAQQGGLLESKKAAEKSEAEKPAPKEKPAEKPKQEKKAEQK